MQTSFYSPEELAQIGLKSYGKNVQLSRKASIYGASHISIGDNVRIDDFCILSGKIDLGNHVHIAAYAALFGGKTGIRVDDFSGISSRCAVYAESDDYSGNYLTNPTIPEKYLNIISGKVRLEKHTLIGTGSTILPGVTIGEGTAVGSMSLINKSLDKWGIYVGIPCKYMKARSKKLLTDEANLLKEIPLTSD